MNDLMLDPEDVEAPPGALGWSARHGFLRDVAALDEAHGEGVVVLVAEDGIVRDVEGDAPLGAVVRLDSDVAVLSDQLAGLRGALQEIVVAADRALAAGSAVREALTVEQLRELVDLLDAQPAARTTDLGALAEELRRLLDDRT